MKSRGVQDKSLEEIILALQEESSMLSPVHQRRMEFLRERRGNSTHSEFLQRLEERVELIELEKLTKMSLVSHIFMEDSDLEMVKITTEILAKNPEGNLDVLLTAVKTTESSSWYKPGRGRANRVTQEEGGGMAPVGKWCDNCRTTTHDTSKFWGPCFGCGAYGHKAVHCKNPKSDHPVSGGAVKKAGDGEASKLSKAAKKRQVKLRKKAKEELKKKEAEAAKRAFLTYQGSGSSAEEESPKKLSARQAKVGGLAGRSLYKELEEMSKGARPKDKKVFEEEVLRAYRAGNVDTEKVDDSATTMGRAYSKYSGGKFMVIKMYLNLFWLPFYENK